MRNQARGDSLKAEAESLFEPDRSEDARGVVQETSCMQHANGAGPQIALPFVGVEHTTELPLVELYRDGIDREVPPREILFNRRMLNRRQEGWLRIGLPPGRRDINLEAIWKRKPRRPEPLYCYSGMFVASWHGVALGLTRHAIDAALAIVNSKLSIFPPPPVPLRQRPHARVALATAEMHWRAARAFTYESIDLLWDEACRTGQVSPERRRAMMESLSFAFRTARQVAQDMYDLAGTTAVFSTKSPLDRLLRDAITMSQHLLLGDAYFEMIGGAILGEPSPHAGIL